MEIPNKDAYFEYHVFLEDGKFSKAEELSWIGLIHDVGFNTICHIEREGELREMGEEIKINPPKGANEVVFKCFDINYDSGECDNYGRYYLKPGFYWKMEVLRYEIFSEEKD